jgi:hypothetical protein
MTSQIKGKAEKTTVDQTRDCRPPANAPKDYCQKLKSGIGRLEATILQQYQETFPTGSEWIGQAIRDAKEAAWSTAFPSLFFPVLAHLRVNEVMPLA